MEEKEKKPKIRFKGFTEAWEQRKVTDVGKVFIGLVTTMTKNYTDVGTLLIRNSDIKDNHFEFDSNPIHLDEGFAKTNDSRRMHIGDVVTVHTGDVGTSAVITEKEDGSIGFATIVTRPNKEIIDSNYLSTYLNTEQHKNWAINQSTGDGRTNYNLKEFTQLIVPLPSLKEQQCISKYVKQIDNLITLHQRKYDKLVNVKKSLLEKMFPKNDSNVPEIRFKGFTEAWEQRKLGACVLIQRGGSPRPIENYLTKKENGVNWIKIGDVSSDSRYITKTEEKIKPEGVKHSREVKVGDLILSNSMSFGRPYIMAINGCIHDGWLLIRNDKDMFDLEYLLQLFSSNYMYQQYQSLASGGVVNNLNSELVQSTTALIPAKLEQQKIGMLFKQVDNLITLHQRKLEKLKNIKKSLLEKMFV